MKGIGKMKRKLLLLIIDGVPLRNFTRLFGNLIDYIERGEIKPLLARSFPLQEITKAQEIFGQKDFVGNFVLYP